MGFVIHGVHDCEANVKADKVAQCERSHGVICAELHCGVNVCGGRNAFLNDGDSLVDHGDKNAVNNKTGSFGHFNGFLADFGAESFDCFEGFVGSVHTANDLNKLHDRCGVEEVHSDELVRALGAGGKLRDGKGACVGCKNGVLGADFIDCSIEIMLDFHILNDCFNHEICGFEVLIVGNKGDVCKNRIRCFLRHLAAINALCKALCEFCGGFADARIGSAVCGNVVARGCENLCDVKAHCACADNEYVFHNA